MVSPILWAFPGSRWREDVEATWKYLKNQYHVTANDRCSTHIHISLDPFYTAPEIKRIAQACIHFEPAFEALVPKTRRQNSYVKSNWLDSPSLARENKSRSQLIAEIEGQVNAENVTRLMQRGKDRDFSWNFWALFRKRTIELRKPPGSTTPEEVLGWAELAMSFIQASVKYENTVQLQKVPATVGGLRWFLSRFSVPGVNEHHRMNRIWAGKDPGAMLEPVPQPTEFWPYQSEAREQKVARLKRLADADRKQIRALARKARPPYW